jgi:hypothetical protein
MGATSAAGTATKYLKIAYHEYQRMIMIIRGLLAMVSSMKSNFNQHGRTVTSVEFSLK